MTFVMIKFVLTKADGTGFTREHLASRDNISWLAREYANVNDGVCRAYEGEKLICTIDPKGV